MSRPGYEQVQVEAFTSLVSEGVYAEDFEHPRPARQFVEACVARALVALPAGRQLEVIDCGCGTGAWLRTLRTAIAASGGRQMRLHGFDITPAMVDVARRTLSGCEPPALLKQGDVLDPQSYVFDATDRTFDIVFVYDVVQQLPADRQWDAVELMLSRLSPGGVLMMFDHDSHSRYGLVMGFKKFVTRRFGIELVPPFYCNARYPPMARFAERIERLGGYRCEVQVASGSPKRALLAYRRHAAPD